MQTRDPSLSPPQSREPTDVQTPVNPLARLRFKLSELVAAKTATPATWGARELSVLANREEQTVVVEPVEGTIDAAVAGLRSASAVMKASRRDVVTGGVGGTAVMLLPAFSVCAKEPPISEAQQIGAAWQEMMVLRGALSVFSDMQDAAIARLPWWARSGPIYIDQNGEHVGPVMGWPAIQGVAPPELPGSLRRLRVGREDIEDDYQSMRGLWGEGAVAKQRDARLAELDARIAAADLERLRVGLPEIDQRYEDAYAAWSDAEDRVSDICKGSLSTAATAALFLIELVRNSVTNASIDGDHVTTEMALASIALRPLLPSLPEPLAIDVAELLDNPQRPIGEMRMSRGIAPEGVGT